MIGQTISHYHILEHLGEGGMGVVYLAEDTVLSRRVAIKFLHATREEPHDRVRFLREARAASSLNHPHIATIYDYGETPDGAPFIVMELISGQTLGKVLAGKGLTQVRAVEIVMAVAAALAEANRHGIVHRDIKPSNIAISERGTVKVLDFGLAKQLPGKFIKADGSGGRATMADTQTAPDVVMGTPLYFSPEQASAGVVDGRSDLFSLGSVLYECLANRPPFSGKNLLEISAQVIHVDPPPPSHFNPQVPPGLDRITLKALAKKPEARYQTAEEFIEDLKAIRDTLHERVHARTQRLSVETTIPTSSMLARALRRPRILLPVTLAFVVTTLATLWVWHYWPHQPPLNAAALYEDGVRALRDGAYYKASKLLEESLKTDENFALTHARLAEAWMEMDYAEKAKDEIINATVYARRQSSLLQTLLRPEEPLYLEAIEATVRRNFGGAIKAYREIARRQPGEAYVHADVGRAYEKNEEIDQAIVSYEQAVNLDPRYAAAFLRLGILHSRKNDMAKATEAFQKAESLYQLHNEAEGVTEVFKGRGALYGKFGKTSEARAQLEAALAITRTPTYTNSYQRISVLLQLSSVFLEIDTSQAKQYAAEAIALAQANRMESLKTMGLLALGNAFVMSGESGPAEDYFKQALDSASWYRGKRSEAHALVMLGNLRIRQGQVDEGLRAVEQALDFYQKGSYRQEAAQAALIIGRAQRQKGDYEAALRAFKQRLENAVQTDDRQLLAASHEAVGSVLLRQEQYPEALYHFMESHKISELSEGQSGVGYSLLNCGNVLWRMGRYEEARARLKQAAIIAEDVGDKELLSAVYIYGSELELSELNFPKAETEIRQAMTMIDPQEMEVIVETKRRLGLAQSLAGARQEGKALCEEAVAKAASLGDPWLLSQSELALAEALIENGDAAKALQIVLVITEKFARTGQRESEGRARLIAARAHQLLGDKTQARAEAKRAADLLTKFPAQWGTEGYERYFNRPDMQSYRKQLEQLMGSA